MKKFCASAFIILIIPFMFPLFVKAYTEEQKELFKEEYYAIYGFYLSEYSLNEVLTKWEQKGVTNNFNCPYLYTFQETSRYANFRLCNSNDRISGTTFNAVSGDCSGSPNVTVVQDGTTWYITTNSFTGSYNNPLNLHAWGSFDEWVDSHIDFDTIYYNPQIPVPKLNIWYLYQVESFREDGVANFAANIDVPDSTEFFVQLAWKYSYPQNIRVYSSDIKGTPAYDYELYKSSDLISIYSLQDQQQAINLHITGADLQTAWQDAYDDFIDGVTFYTNQSNAPANWLSTARLNYVNKMATQIPLYGNRLEVFARYWTLTEDNNVVVGKWYHWQSAKGSATEEIPETYVNYQELPGYAGTVETVPSDDENTYTGSGTSTGEQATTVINYAPNYPDYPTAVTYNHDNILLQMIQTSKQLPQFFGQFTNFLAITLAFIDPGVWAIIGFGFTCCIVIMIIKVL